MPQPSKPAAPAKPIASVKPIAPAKPSALAKSVVPAKPAAPAKSVVLVKSVAPASAKPAPATESATTAPKRKQAPVTDKSSPSQSALKKLR